MVLLLGMAERESIYYLGKMSLFSIFSCLQKYKECPSSEASHLNTRLDHYLACLS